MTATGGRDWSNEPWTKVFTRDSARWCRLSLAARGLYCLLQRAADRSGRVEVEDDAAEALAHHLRAPAEAIEPPLAELLAAGYVVAEPGWLALPEHIEQLATRSSAAARQRSSRSLSPPVTACHRGSPPVTIDQIDQIDKIDQIIDRSDQIAEQTRAPAPAPARAAPAKAPAKATTKTTTSDDPRAKALVAALGFEPRFADLDHDQVAEALLGALGPLGLAVSAELAAQAVSRAALEAEAGAPERRLRQLLGWALRDAVAPRARGGSRAPHQVQGEGEDLDKFTANLLAGRPAWQ